MKKLQLFICLLLLFASSAFAVVPIASSPDDVSALNFVVWTHSGEKVAYLLAEHPVVTTSGGYPGWKPNVKSEILKVACDTYKELFAADAKIKAIHAGLECGLFLEKAPQLDMISFGPTMRGVHSPDERLDIASTERWWRHLVALLENAPQK